ncbi:MAG: BCD family MFS transporter [Maricaulaceae bacterium]
MSDARGLSWVDIVRLGLVQTALGSIVVLATATFNRVMVVELALPATLAGVLIAWHYVVQLTRPHWGYGSDRGGKRTPWILGGVAVLALGGLGAALATAWMASNLLGGIITAFFAYMAIGAGMGAAGTSLLAMLATHVTPKRRAMSAALVWIMMIIGFILTAGIGGALLDPFSLTRMVWVTAGACAIAMALATVALWGVEARAGDPIAQEDKPKLPFSQMLALIWDERQSRRFTVFVLISMLAYNLQDLILEPFSGLVFGLTPGQSTQLSGTMHQGVLLGMLSVGAAGWLAGGQRAGWMQGWTVFGCLGSALTFAGIAVGGVVGESWPLHLNVFLCGATNGAFAVAAIGSMMGLAGAGGRGREGIRMGLFGAAQAIGFGLGQFFGALGVDVFGAVMANPHHAYAVMFGVEAGLFVLAAYAALRVGQVASPGRPPILPAGEPAAAAE